MAAPESTAGATPWEARPSRAPPRVAGPGRTHTPTRGGAVAARWAHNPKVAGSNPAPATPIPSGGRPTRVGPRFRVSDASSSMRRDGEIQPYHLVARDWKPLSAFYQDVFGCIALGETRDLRGEWLERLTGIEKVHVVGEHLRLPGYGDAGPTLEIFSHEPLGAIHHLMPNSRWLRAYRLPGRRRACGASAPSCRRGLPGRRPHSLAVCRRPRPHCGVCPGPRGKHHRDPELVAGIRLRLRRRLQSNRPSCSTTSASLATSRLVRGVMSGKKASNSAFDAKASSKRIAVSWSFRRSVRVFSSCA